jgi:D-sedoheptulose 7-phosphate isomerase
VIAAGNRQRAGRVLHFMSVLEQRLQQPFFDSADLMYQAAESLSRPLVEALQALVGGITGGGKLVVAGGALAPHAAALLVHGFERERPPLAALALGADPVPLRALGLPGDVLLLLDDGLSPVVAQALVSAAHEKDMAVVAFGGSTAGGAAPAWRASLTETDVAVIVPHERPARVREVQLLMLHTLADAIDHQLLGEQDPA